MTKQPILDQGTLSFSIESRILRELGERLVKQPEVAVVELVKNAYDADAAECTITYDLLASIKVEDDGHGMTLQRFIDGWMRIGTSSKEAIIYSEKFGRLITGEKGIGRFAVRFLGRALHLESVAYDPGRKRRTKLIADFDWPQFDLHEDLGEVKVPYRLEGVTARTPLGTTLIITRLRPEIAQLDLRKVQTGSIGVLTPLRSLFRQITDGSDIEQPAGEKISDPGFVLNIQEDDDENDHKDVAATILDGFVLRASVELQGDKMDLKVYRRGETEPYLAIVDTYPSHLGKLYADIRFFPRRKGSFTEMPVDGRFAYSWIVDNAGIAVFDRNFRVQPYGMASDDWLQLAADAARNRRDPRSAIAKKHFSMSAQVRAAPSENWMLRLPQPAQLVGLIQVEGRRTDDPTLGEDDEGLVASADREGFVENKAFSNLKDIVRGAVEAIAFADRRLQLEEEQAQRRVLVASIRQETQSAISEIQSNPNIAAPDKAKIVSALAQTQYLAERQEETARERERQLEIMSLLGVVAGFMTHEFGVALQELEKTHADLKKLAKSEPKFAPIERKFSIHIKSLREFVTYSSGYIQGTKTNPKKAYFVKPRLQRVKRVFGKYAEERNISVEVSVEADLMAPLVPASLYDGIALNLYTNALKAVTAKTGGGSRKIAFRSWNDNHWHYLEVSDTGVGIPAALHKRVFDPLFTTTDSRRDPLGSGMGLGLSLVKRGAEAFGGRAELIQPPPDFATCVRVRIPADIESA